MFHFKVLIDFCFLIAERERRHFPHVYNQCSTPVFRSHGRRYIPHGYGFYDEWTPHGQNVQIQYSEYVLLDMFISYYTMYVDRV